MRSIIRQNTIALELPDFRNLGTILRILLAVNALTAVAALVREPQYDLWAAQWLEMSATVEPHLLFELAAALRDRAVARAAAAADRRTGDRGADGRASGSACRRSSPARFRSRRSHCCGTSLLALGVCGVLIAYFHLRARALSPAITEARLQALQARIRPHFLFNSINAVLSLMRSDPKQAETALEDMADLFRVLMRDNRELVPLADEVELCRQYLALEKLRLTDRLNVEWHLKSMPGDALVPPLVLQPLLENAVYHGIEPSSAPGVVSINIFYKGGEVHAILRNPYQAAGGRHHAGNKMALANIRERLTLHFDAEGSLESRVRDAIYEVHIRMPYRSTGSAAPAKGAASADERAKASRDVSARERRRVRRGRRSPMAAAVRRMADAPLRVLIVDDEAPARRRLRELLDDCAGALPLVVVGEAASGREALDLLHAVSADLVLTDIHMPDMDGLELARHVLKLPQPPVVIFTTAHDEHALQAFEVNAVDYLMKPVRVQRLLAALEKVPRLKPVTASEARPAAGLGAPLPVGDRALARGPGPGRRDRLSQGGAQVHHDPHAAARVPARGIADQARGGVRAAFRPRPPQLPRRARLHPRLRAPRGRRRRRALGGAAEGRSRDAAGVAPAAVRSSARSDAKSFESLIHSQPMSTAHAHLRFARLRHHHGVPRPLRAAHPPRADAHAVGVVPDRRDAPRMGRLRRATSRTT